MYMAMRNSIMNRVLSRSSDLGGLRWMSSSSSSSLWKSVEPAPKDPILGVSEAFSADPSPDKVNGGVGAYRDDNGKPVVPDCVREAERRTAGNSFIHNNIWRDAHVPQRTYHYYHPETKGLNFAGVMDDIKNAPNGSADLKNFWLKDVKVMADRIIGKRTALRENFKKLGSPLSSEHITNQIGMFCYSGKMPKQVDRVTNEFHIYMTRNKNNLCINTPGNNQFRQYSSDSQNHEKTSLIHTRPLSPHLPIYKPQLNSTFSILNRISGAFLAAEVLLFYLVYMKMGLICFTYVNFYHFLIASSKLIPLSAGLSALALSYHVFYGVRRLLSSYQYRR